MILKQVVAAAVIVVKSSLFVVVYCLSNALTWSIICKEISSMFLLFEFVAMFVDFAANLLKMITTFQGRFLFCSECELIMETKEFSERFRQFSLWNSSPLRSNTFRCRETFWPTCLFMPYSLPFYFEYSFTVDTTRFYFVWEQFPLCWGVGHKCCHCTGSIWRDLWISYCSMSMCSRILCSIFVSFLILNNF